MGPTLSLQDNYGMPTAHMTVWRDSLDTDVQMRLQLSSINSEIKRFAKLRNNVLLHDILVLGKRAEKFLRGVLTYNGIICFPR